MCIAIVKPKNVDFPTEKQFRNCFNTNPHGCGFMYSDGEYLIIKKGFMTFEEFYEAFKEENISKDKLVFFHFRIATHGLIDEGNTHPFPLSMNVNIQRTKELKFKGYGLIHNGVFIFNKEDFWKYDKQNIISDTMLLSMKIKESIDNNIKEDFDTFEGAIAYYLSNPDKIVKELIDEYIGFNKIAIMNEKEDLAMFGKWIEDNGVYYSNDDYDDTYYTYYQNHTFDGYDYDDDICFICGNVLEQDKCYETTDGYICEECRNSFQFKICEDCGVLMFNTEDNGTPYCNDCLEIREYYKNKNDYNTLDCDMFGYDVDDKIEMPDYSG